jgi:hypothetical protein
MSAQITTIGPLQAEVRLRDENVVHATVVAFRWDINHPHTIDAYLALVRAGHPNELSWISPDTIQRFR